MTTPKEMRRFENVFCYGEMRISETYTELKDNSKEAKRQVRRVFPGIGRHKKQKSREETSSFSRYEDMIHRKNFFIDPTAISIFQTSIAGFHGDLIRKISCSYNHGLLLLTNGDVYSFGENKHGKLGILTEEKANSKLRRILSRASDVATGRNHSAVISDGLLYTFGCSQYGQTGHGHIQDVNEPTVVEYFRKINVTPLSVSCGENHTLVMCENGLVYGYGLGEKGQLGMLSHLHPPLSCEREAQIVYHLTPNVMKHLEKIPEVSKHFREFHVRRSFFLSRSIACGANYSLVVSDRGKLFFCGENITGLGGQGSLSNQFKVVPCIFERFLNRNVDQVNVEFTLKNSEEMLSVNVQATITSEIITSPEPDEIIQVSCSSEHIVCLDKNSNVFVCGLNRNGQLGLNDRRNRKKLSFVPLPRRLRESGIKTIGSGSSFTALLSNDGELFVSGRIEASCSDLLVPTCVPNLPYVSQLFSGKDCLMVVL